MYFKNQIVFIFILLFLTSCTKEIIEKDSRIIKYIDPRLKAYVPNFHEEYVEFDRNGRLWGAFYFSKTRYDRVDTNCISSSCQYTEYYSNTTTMNVTYHLATISTSSKSDTPYFEIKINNNINTVKMYLTNDYNDIDSTMTKDKNYLPQFQKVASTKIGGLTYKNVYLVVGAGYAYNFYYSKELGIIRVEDNFNGIVEIIK